jgi:VanZ family protein
MILPVWLAIILVGSVLPVSSPVTYSSSDKVVHFILYGLTAILFFRRYMSRKARKGAMLSAILLSSSYGALIEILQYFLPYREFSAGDIAANISGAFVFCIVYAQRRKHET